MMTPEPSAAQLRVVTFTLTTAGRTLAMIASRTACILLPLSGGTVDCGPVPGCNVATFELAPPVDALVLPNCQPANKPTTKTNTSTSAKIRIVLVRNPSPERRRLTDGVEIYYPHEKFACFHPPK